MITKHESIAVLVTHHLCLSHFFVQNLNLSHTSSHILTHHTLTHTCTQVLEVRIVRDRHTHESKGFGFVRMGSEQAAATALHALDNYLIGEEGCRPGGCRV